MGSRQRAGQDSAAVSRSARIPRWLRNKHGATILALRRRDHRRLAKTGCRMELGHSRNRWTHPLATLWGNEPAAGRTGVPSGRVLSLAASVPAWFIVLPMVFMLVMPAWAMIQQLPAWIWPAKGQIRTGS